MPAKLGQRSVRGILLSLVTASLLLACQLPVPPRATAESPLQTPLVGQSPLDTPAVPDAQKGEGGFAVWMPLVGNPQGTDGGTRVTWPLVLLAGVAGLLFAATAAGVFFLVRGLPRLRRRRKPSPPPQVDLEGAPLATESLLSAGTMLNEGRFLVLSGREMSDGAHVYEVKPTVPMDLCPHCATRVTPEAGSHCPNCRHLLPEHRPEHPVLVAHVVTDRAVYAGQAALVKRALSHPALVLPIAVFEEAAFGADCYVAVMLDVQQRLAEALQSPPSLHQVLAWGIDLAEGLEALHEAGYIITKVSSQRVQVDADEARWLLSDAVMALPDLASEAGRAASPDPIAANVRALARLLTSIVSHSGADATLSEPARRVLTQVSAAKGRLRAGDFAVALARAREAILAHQSVHHIVGAASDVGHLRKVNEDSFLALDLASRLEWQNRALSVTVVADGVGGHDAGDVASQLTVAALQRASEALTSDLESSQTLDVASWIVRAATAANEAVFAERTSMGSDMGSTLVMAVVDGNHVKMLNVGDSRGYRLRPGGIEQVTKDHSLVQRLIDIGQLTPEEARQHPQRSVIYRVMGDTPQLSYDLFELDLAPGEAILLCSDGLSDLVEDRVLWQTWHDASTPQVTCERLVDLANEGGGYDNITVVILQLQA